MAGRRNTELYIDTREDTKLKDTEIPAGSSSYTSIFSLLRDGTAGAFAFYIDCEGMGTFNLSYEIDPGIEAGPTVPGYTNEWFIPDYRNPIKTDILPGKVVIPLKLVIGQFIRFKIEAVDSNLLVNYIRLVIQ